MARSAAVCGRKRGSPASGVASDSRKARAHSRRIAVSISRMVAALQPVGQDHDRLHRARRRRSAAPTGRPAASARCGCRRPSRRPVRPRGPAPGRGRGCAAPGDAGQPRAEGEDLGAVGALHDGVRELADSPPCAASSSRKRRSASAACAAPSGGGAAAARGCRHRRSRFRAASGADRACRANGCAPCGRSGGRAARTASLRRKAARPVVVALEVARCSSCSSAEDSSPPFSWRMVSLCFLARAAVILDAGFLVLFAFDAAAGASP